MALKMPKGVQFGFAQLDTADPLPASGFTSANPAVATGVTAAAGTVVVVDAPGFPGINNVATELGAAGVLLGVDTSNTRLYPTGTSGPGAVRTVGDFVDFTQQGEPTTSGGEQQFWNGQLLEDPTGRQISIPTFKNAKVLTLPLYYDASLPWYDAAKEVDAIGDPVVLRMSIPGGDVLYRYGYLTFDGDPTITANTPMGNTMTFTALGDSVLVEADA